MLDSPELSIVELQKITSYWLLGLEVSKILEDAPGIVGTTREHIAPGVASR